MLRGLPAQGGFEAAYYGMHLLAAGVSIMPWANVWHRHVLSHWLKVCHVPNGV